MSRPLVSRGWERPPKRRKSAPLRMICAEPELVEATIRLARTQHDGNSRFRYVGSAIRGGIRRRRTVAELIGCRKAEFRRQAGAAHPPLRA
eukprot:scaffold510_cov242-Pinguiococcus_pyrenoidosus.AAC.12